MSPRFRAAFLALTLLAAQPAPVAELVHAFRDDPGSAEANRRLWDLVRTAPPDLADAVAEAMDELGPDGPVAAGALLRRALRPLEALEAFDRAPGRPRAGIEAGWTLAELRLDERALERFRDAPGPAARYGAAFVLARLGRSGEALEELRGADPANPAVALLRAELLDSAGREAEAVELLRRSRAGGLGALRLARLLTRQGNHAEAAGILESLVDAAPEHGEAWLALARVREGAGAVEAFERALAHRPDLNEARLGLGRLLARRGEREEADRLLDEFERRKGVADESARLLGEAELRPDDAAAWSAFVVHALKTDNPGLALRAAQRALALEPEDPDRRRSLARVWRELGRPEEAERVLAR